jgi:hypothetical protein
MLLSTRRCSTRRQRKARLPPAGTSMEQSGNDRNDMAGLLDVICTGVTHGVGRWRWRWHYQVHGNTLYWVQRKGSSADDAMMGR